MGPRSLVKQSSGVLSEKARIVQLEKCRFRNVRVFFAKPDGRVLMTAAAALAFVVVELHG